MNIKSFLQQLKKKKKKSTVYVFYKDQSVLVTRVL